MALPVQCYCLLNSAEFPYSFFFPSAVQYQSCLVLGAHRYIKNFFLYLFVLFHFQYVRRMPHGMVLCMTSENNYRLD